jgi:hypothetical protein
VGGPTDVECKPMKKMLRVHNYTPKKKDGCDPQVEQNWEKRDKYA